MLERLTINNLALIHSQTIEFGKNFNVLTGETGAGKSLIVDALSLLLGEKADKSLVSKGEKFASVEAVFTSVKENVKKVLCEFGLDEDDTIIITRKLGVDGRNECRVNGNSFTLSMLKKLSAPLMDLHGQFEHQNLLKVQNHLKILDMFGGKEVEKLKNEYYELYTKYNSVVDELNDFNGDDLERNRLIDLYKYQIDEIEEANFHDGEEEELKEYRNQVLHQEKIVEAVSSAVKMTSGDGYEYSGAIEGVKKVITLLGSVSQFYDKLNPIIERLESARIELDDISNSLEEEIDKLYIDEEKAKENENRLDLLSSLKKKYGASVSEINEYLERTKNEFLRLTSATETIEQLKQQKDELSAKIIEIAAKLTQKRCEIAKNFEEAITKELKDLSMKNAKFVVKITKLDFENKQSTGLDSVEFMFSANLGEEVKPLKNVASGGEMSRFMLAVKNVTAKLEGIETLVFDEIDTGVSGVVALSLAKKLKSVGKIAQVICVSHLPQIASYADNHLLIEKIENNNTTTTSVAAIKGEAREREIARLISGNITEHSLLHARELLAEGKNF